MQHLLVGSVVAIDDEEDKAIAAEVGVWSKQAQLKTTHTISYPQMISASMIWSFKKTLAMMILTL